MLSSEPESSIGRKAMAIHAASLMRSLADRVFADHMASLIDVDQPQAIGC